MKNKGGRPTKYYPAIVDKVEDYFKTVNTDELPSIEGLANYMDISRDTIYEWQKHYPKFSYTIKKILIKQKLKLMNDGMYGGKEVNAGMAIFLLKANHGLSDGSGLTQINIKVKPILGGASVEGEVIEEKPTNKALKEDNNL